MAVDPPIDAMVVAIVPSDTASKVQAALIEAQYRVTRMHTAGGFLRRGNVSLLAGVAASEVEAVLALVRASSGDDGTAESMDGALQVFVLPVASFSRI